MRICCEWLFHSECSTNESLHEFAVQMDPSLLKIRQVFCADSLSAIFVLMVKLIYFAGHVLISIGNELLYMYHDCNIFHLQYTAFPLAMHYNTCMSVNCNTVCSACNVLLFGWQRTVMLFMHVNCNIFRFALLLVAMSLPNPCIQEINKMKKFTIIVLQFWCSLIVMRSFFFYL